MESLLSAYSADDVQTLSSLISQNKSLLEQKVEIHHFSHNFTIFQKAILDGKLEIVKMLVNMDSDLLKINDEVIYQIYKIRYNFMTTLLSFWL